MQLFCFLFSHFSDQQYMPQKDSKTKPLTTGFKGIQDYLENPALVETNN